MVTPPTTETVAERVRAAMEQTGQTTKGLADAAGLPRTTLVRRLTGNSSFTLSEIDVIAPLLDTTVRALLADEPRQAASA